MIFLALVGCKKKIEVNFQATPALPRAGEAVTFKNVSSGGEDWSWTFGDGGTSTLKSPTHTFKKPGEYLVRLTVDKKKWLTHSLTITVSDTVPTFTCDNDLFVVYTDYTFKAQVYNPYNLKLEYLWSLPGEDDYAVVTSKSMTESSITLYFTEEEKRAPLALRIVMDGKDTTEILQEFYIYDVPTNSILMRTDEGDFRQSIFAPRFADPVEDPTAETLLDLEQDTAQFYNGKEFTLSEIAEVFPGIEGFHINSRKIYYRLNGLWVANIDGAYAVQIDSLPCSAMTLDHTDNRIYWANENGVWYLPFIGSDNNRFVTTPTRLNAMGNVTRIAEDPEKK